MLNSKKNRYKIIIEPNGVILLGGLFVISSILVFYLGLSFGRIEKTSLLETELNKQATTSLNKDLSLLKIDTSSKSVSDYQKKLAVIDSSLKIPAKILNSDNSQFEQAQSASSFKPLSGASEDGYTIQVALMKNLEHANQLLHKLRKENFDAYILTTPNINGDIRYRVRIGVELDKSELDKQLGLVVQQFAELTTPTVHKYGHVE